MSQNGALVALAGHALGNVRDYSIVGLGSGRAAAILVRALGRLLKQNDYHVVAIPTSLQIKQAAEESDIPLVEADQVDHIDVMFDGADQINSEKFVIKGGGGALLRENILFGLAKKVIVMADRTKFVKNFTSSVPVEIHPLARVSAAARLEKLGSSIKLRTLARGYPFITENGNIILDCDFGVITTPMPLTRKIKQIPGVIESGIFSKKPDIIYKAMAGSKFEII
ncbi:MAG: ribose 5-phosphate isomerase A [Nitrosopumilus sp. B06]|nr:MAG: ribose 5-phosphate isomerase A [Nitrosopumilus sp. B06]